MIERFGEWVYRRTRPRWTPEEIQQAEDRAIRLKIMLFMTDEEKTAIFERARRNTVMVNPWAYRGG